VIVASPRSAAAHPGGEPFIHVPLDHIIPGEAFPIVAADLGPEAHVTMRLTLGDVSADLGVATAGPDGHFRATLTLPPTFPLGYAQLTASSDDGSAASTWVRVGSEPVLLASETVAPDRVDLDLVPLAAAALAFVALAVLFLRTRRPTAIR
jgi:hypothetical protein